jgi:hypothetical protein
LDAIDKIYCKTGNQPIISSLSCFTLVDEAQPPQLPTNEAGGETSGESAQTGEENKLPNGLPTEGVLTGDCPSILPHACLPDEADCTEEYSSALKIDMGTKTFTYGWLHSITDAVPGGVLHDNITATGSGSVLSDGWLLGNIHIAGTNRGIDLSTGADLGPYERDETIIGEIFFDGSPKVRICIFSMGGQLTSVTEDMKQRLYNSCNYVCTLH